MSAKWMPCVGCDRHLRSDETSCPFCGVEVVRVATPGVPLKRLGRAAMFAFGATALATGCGDSHGPDDGGDDFDAGPGGDVDAGFDAGNAAPPYGIPPFDGGPGDDDAGPGEDAGGDAGTNVALYGGAPEP